MRRILPVLSLIVLGACTSSAGKGTESGAGDGTTKATSCQDLRPRIESLYQRAADDEKVAPNLRADFLESNVHMVMVDCQADPKRVGTCLSKVGSVREIETECLLPLDDEGTVEGRRFSDAP